MEFLPELVIAYVMFDISVKILNGNATIGDYSLYTGLIGQLWGAIQILTVTLIQIYENKLKINNVESFDDIPKRIMDNGKQVLKKVCQIKFRKVSFCYPGTNKKVLDNIDFCINDEERVAFVGANGSGKSTIIKLLLRFYNVSNGEILINNIDVHNYTLKSLHENFSCYFQNSLNYGFTINENIALSDFGFALDVAVKYSGVNTFMWKCSNGTSSYLTRAFDESGVELSGGEHQKIALARTFYRKNCAIILDEPSSNLDPESENNVFQALDKFCAKKTVIFTSHRLSNIVLADRIIVLEGGCIIEEGTKEALLKNPGRFSELYKYQSDKFQE